MRHYQPSLVLAFVFVLLVVLCIKPYEACRSVPAHNEEKWEIKNHLFLPSLQWKPVTPPKSNPGTNSALPGAKNFAAAATEKHVLLPSLWRPVTPPKSNPGTNAALAGEKNFAAAGLMLPLRREKSSTHLLLPSLQWRPVTSPSTNPGHNGASTVSEQNFVAGKMKTFRPSTPSPKHHTHQLPEMSHKAAS